MTPITYNPVMQGSVLRGSGYEFPCRISSLQELCPVRRAVEPLEEHDVSSRSRRQQGILVFLARDAEQRVFRYANAGIPKADQANDIQFFHLDALSSMVGLNVDVDLPLTLMAGSLYRLMAQRIGREYAHAQPTRLFCNLLHLSARVDIEATRVVVTFDTRAHNPFLVAAGFADTPTPMPWFGNKQLVLQFA